MDSSFVYSNRVFDNKFLKQISSNVISQMTPNYPMQPCQGLNFIVSATKKYNWSKWIETLEHKLVCSWPLANKKSH